MPALVSGTSVDKQANAILGKYIEDKPGSPNAWYELLKNIDFSKLPLEQTQKINDAAYAGWEGARPFLPPVGETKGKTNLHMICDKFGISIDDYHKYSLDNPRKWVVTMLNEMVMMPLKNKNGRPFKLTEENLQHITNIMARDGKIDYQWVPDAGFNPANIFERNALTSPNSISLTNRNFYSSSIHDKQYNNKERYEAICQAANFLVYHGVKEGQYVPFITRANDEHDIIKYAAMAVGAIPVMLPSTHSDKFLEKDLSQFPKGKLAPIAIVHDYTDSMSREIGHNVPDAHPIYNKFKNVLPKVVAITKPQNKESLSANKKQNDLIITFDELLKDQGKNFNIIQRKVNDTFLVIGSSGTSEKRESEKNYSPPKMLGLNGSTYWEYASTWCLCANLKKGDGLQQVAGAVWMMQELSSFGTAANNANYHMTDAALTSKEYWQSVADKKLKKVIVSPPIIKAMRENNILDSIKLEVEEFYCSGDKPAHDDMLWLATRVKGGARIFQIMGGTEQNVTVGASPDFTCHLDDTFTMITPTRELYIAKKGDRLTTTTDPKDTDKKLAKDTEYFILFQPDFVPPGLSIEIINFNNEEKYYHPAKTVKNRNGVEVQAREHGDGLGYVNSPTEKPVLVCYGRVDDKLKISGEDVSPGQLEACVKGAIESGKIKGIKDVIVAGVKDDQFQQKIVYAVLVNNDEAGRAFQSPEGRKTLMGLLRTIVKEHLPTKAKVDDVVIYTDALPKTDNGKPKRNQVGADLKLQKKTELGSDAVQLTIS